MAEQTNPATGVSQVAPEDVNARMQNFLTQFDENSGDEEEKREAQPEPETPKVAEEAKQPEGQADEPTPEDIPDEEAEQPSAVDEFEIVHNGTNRKVTREEVIRLAQQGFDYTQKTQDLAKIRQVGEQRLAAIQEAEQLQPYLAQDLAQVKAIEAQLAQYDNVDWVQIATDDPLEYPKHRARYDTLRNAYTNARGQYEQKANYVNSNLAQIKQEMLQEEAKKLPELIPEWKDPAKFEAGRATLTKYLMDLGADPYVIGQKTQDAMSVAIVYKAMKYDQLVKGKAEKVKQLRTVPPVTRPGASQGNSAKADETKKLSDRLRKTGDLKDAAALLLTRL